MKDCSGADISNWPDCVRVMKRQEAVQVAFAESAGTLLTQEGVVPFAEGDALIARDPTDKWPVMRTYFERSYTPCLDTSKGQPGLYTKKDLVVLAVQIQEAFTTTALQGVLLQGVAGDWLVQYGPGHHGIVSQEIFAKSYSLVQK